MVPGLMNKSFQIYDWLLQICVQIRPEFFLRFFGKAYKVAKKKANQLMTET